MPANEGDVTGSPEPRPARVLVIGASGGIGRALVGAFCQQDGIEVVALSRRPIADLPVRQQPIDIEDEDSIRVAAATLRDGVPVSRIIVATGLLHAGDLGPERRNAALDERALMRLYAVNAVGPAIVAKHFLPLLPKAEPSVFGILSARVGSIGDNRLGGWHGYRAAKAALNQLIRTMSIELKRTHPGAILVGLHPGTVDTPLSRPFQAGVAEGRLFTPAIAAGHLIKVCNGLREPDSGHVFAWDGSRIPA
jgi:NAD(P)-dependent dehydrogenase (short-subunit alcohol dehydrogenase family)